MLSFAFRFLFDIYIIHITLQTHSQDASSKALQKPLFGPSDERERRRKSQTNEQNGKTERENPDKLCERIEGARRARASAHAHSPR